MINATHGLVVALLLLSAFVLSFIGYVIVEMVPLVRAWSEYWRNENAGASVETKDEACEPKSS